MGILSKEPFSVSADGHAVKKGKTFFYGEHKVKVLEVFPSAGVRGARVKATKVGIVFADQLYYSKTGKYIGGGD